MGDIYILARTLEDVTVVSRRQRRRSFFDGFRLPCSERHGSFDAARKVRNKRVVQRIARETHPPKLGRYFLTDGQNKRDAGNIENVLMEGFVRS
jgi:hypothetical protein